MWIFSFLNSGYLCAAQCELYSPLSLLSRSFAQERTYDGLLQEVMWWRLLNTLQTLSEPPTYLWIHVCKLFPLLAAMDRLSFHNSSECLLAVFLDLLLLDSVSYLNFLPNGFSYHANLVALSDLSSFLGVLWKPHHLPFLYSIDVHKVLVSLP